MIYCSSTAEFTKLRSFLVLCSERNHKHLMLWFEMSFFQLHEFFHNWAIEFLIQIITRKWDFSCKFSFMISHFWWSCKFYIAVLIRKWFFSYMHSFTNFWIFLAFKSSLTIYTDKQFLSCMSYQMMYHILFLEKSYIAILKKEAFLCHEIFTL